MDKWTNFAGRDTELLDGNLGADSVPDLVSVLVIGTAESGPTERVVALSSETARTTEDARLLYGTDGTLMQGVYEAIAAGAPSVKMYRIAGQPAVLSGIGNAVTITTVDREDDISADYKLSWFEKVLKVWRIDSETSGTLVYEADMSGDFAAVEIDLVEVDVEKDGTADDADEFGDGTFENAVTFEELVEATTVVPGTTYTKASGAGWNWTLVAADSEAVITKKELYEELYRAYRILEDFNLHIICPMGAYLDEYNVADMDYEGSAPSPSTYFKTDDYLGYLKVEDDPTGDYTFTWSDTQVDDDYHEVNFAYQLANFCHQMTTNELTVHGVVGVRPPSGLAQPVINAWIGALPTINQTTGDISTNGSGLLGNKFLAGHTDWTAGFWGTEDGWLDSPDILQDSGGVNVDIGRYISISGQWYRLVNVFGKIKNSRQVSYLASGAPTYAAFIAGLDPDIAPSYKKLNNAVNVSVPYRVSKSKLHDMAGLHYIVLRPTAAGLRIADGPTAAQETSDYRRFTTFNIIKYCDREIRTILDDYIGIGMNLQRREALKTRLENRFKDIKSAGIVQRTAFRVVQTASDAVAGQLYVYADIVPSFETRRISLVITPKKQ